MGQKAQHVLLENKWNDYNKTSKINERDTQQLQRTIMGLKEKQIEYKNTQNYKTNNDTVPILLQAIGLAPVQMG